MELSVAAGLASGDFCGLRSFGRRGKTDRRMSTSVLLEGSVLCLVVLRELLPPSGALRADFTALVLSCGTGGRFLAVDTGEQYWLLEPLLFAAAFPSRLFFAVDLCLSDNFEEGVLGGLHRFFMEDE